MNQEQYNEEIHRIAVLARELCIKRNHAAMDLYKTCESAWNNLKDLINRIGIPNRDCDKYYKFKTPKKWGKYYHNGIGIVKTDDGRERIKFYPDVLDNSVARGNDCHSYDNEIGFVLSMTDHIVRELGEP